MTSARIVAVIVGWATASGDSGQEFHCLTVIFSTEIDLDSSSDIFYGDFHLLQNNCTRDFSLNILGRGI